jgi:hypothetical protein
VSEPAILTFRYRSGNPEAGPCLVCGRHVTARVGLRYRAQAGGKTIERAVHPSCARVKTTPPDGASGPGDIDGAP